MRRMLLLAVIGLLVGAGVVALIEQDAGQLLVSYGDTTIETSLWIGVMLWLLIWGLLVLLLRLVRSTLGARASVAGWLGNRKVRNAEVLTNRGLVSFIEGNWTRSRRQLLQAARYNNAPLLNYLMAARASHRLGDLEGMQRYLGEAEAVDSEAVTALELTQAELQLSAGQYEQALATLVRARSNAGKHPYVLELLAKAYSRLADWGSLRELLPELRRHEVLPAETLRDLEIQTWLELLKGECGTDGASPDSLSRLWSTVPTPLQRAEPALRQRYLACLIELEGHARAEKLLLDTLEREWQPELVQYLGVFPLSKPDKVFKQVQKWLEQRSRDPVLLLAAGRVALQANAWDDAQAHFQSAYQLRRTAETCLELARLREAQGDTDVATTLYREAAELGVGSMARLPLPERHAELPPPAR